MPTAHTAHDVAAVDAALRQLPASAERHLRLLFGIGTRAPAAARMVADTGTRRRHRLESAAFRTLRRQALIPPDSSGRSE
jgi:hypothetical protein